MKNRNGLPGYMTPAEAAEYLDVDPAQISRYVSSGKLHRVHFGAFMLLYEDEVKKFERPAVGNPDWIAKRTSARKAAQARRAKKKSR